MLVQCIAATSQLQRLDIVLSGRKPKALNGDALISQIIPVHGKTLQKLKIPHFHISSAKLRYLFLRCKYLKALWLGVTTDLQVSIQGLVILKLMRFIAPSSHFAGNLMFARSDSDIWERDLEHCSRGCAIWSDVSTLEDP